MNTLALSELATFIRRVFALNLPEAVWVTAEVASSHESRGHRWLTLVEKDAEGSGIVAQLDAVIWSGTLATLRQTHGSKLTQGVLAQGRSVRLQVTTSFHERFGLKLVVTDLDPDHTLGSLARIREATLAALQTDGLLDRRAALPFPTLPQRLAIISAEGAAGYADFRRQLAENPYGYRFTYDLYAAAMQGTQTTGEVVTRLRQIARRADAYDCIVLIRGGGGKTDLAAFDEEVLCRALAGAALPVVTGIGHEVDETVADRVVDRSLKTPTAAAVFLVERLLGAEGETIRLGRQIARYATEQINRRADRLRTDSTRVAQSVEVILQRSHLRSAAQLSEIERSSRQATATADRQLKHQETLLEALRPETTLARGYALVSQAGKLVTAPENLGAGPVDVRLKEGRTVLRKD